MCGDAAAARPARKGELPAPAARVTAILTQHHLQACLAWRNDGGRVVVVLSQRDKLAMEGDFRRLLPPAARFGTRFVFRQARPRCASRRPGILPALVRQGLPRHLRAALLGAPAPRLAGMSCCSACFCSAACGRIGTRLRMCP